MKCHGEDLIAASICSISRSDFYFILRMRIPMSELYDCGGQSVRHLRAYLLCGLLHCTACGTAMSPSVTRLKGRVHRYYVFGNAAKNGWKSCPHPSLLAGQIKDAVVERIACIGRNPGLLQETLGQLKSLKATRQPALVAEPCYRWWEQSRNLYSARA